MACESTKSIRQLKNSPETKDIKIIAVTGLAMESDRENTMKMGADGYMAKPIDIRQLPEAIERLFER
jgi:CheY-like chemotaxis protein